MHAVSTSVPRVVRRANVNRRVTDYLEEKSVDMPTPAECRQYFTTNGLHNVLADLRGNGFCVLQNWLKLPADNSGVLEKMREETIFEHFNLVPTPTGCKFTTSRGSGRRVQTKKIFSNKLLTWGDISKQLDELFTNVWPDCQLKYEATRLCSKGQAPVQGVHCDNAEEGSYSKHHKFPVDVMISISHKDDTFLDIRPTGTNKNVRVLLRRGDLLIFRGDVAHRGVENPSENPHYRLHVYVDHILEVVEPPARSTRSKSKQMDQVCVTRGANETYYVHVGFSNFKL